MGLGAHPAVHRQSLGLVVVAGLWVASVWVQLMVFLGSEWFLCAVD